MVAHCEQCKEETKVTLSEKTGEWECKECARMDPTERENRAYVNALIATNFLAGPKDI